MAIDKYILVEMADYFDTVLKPRIQKVVYAADWRDGKPVPGSPGQSHMFQYHPPGELRGRAQQPALPGAGR